MNASFLWRALGSIQERMGCLFSKRKDKSDAYLCADGTDDDGDEHAAAERAGTSGRTHEAPAARGGGGGFGNGAFGSAGPAAAQSQAKVRPRPRAPPARGRAARSRLTPAARRAGRRQTYPWDNRPKLDPKDFMFVRLTGGVHVKPPGSINGQQFIIDSCEDCELYVLDHTAQVTIDDCRNCRIFVGPTEASVFVRDCEDCRCAFVCRQFRTRDVRNVDVSLHCATRPVIETSRGLRFGCYDFNYAGLDAQLAACAMSVYANHYSHIHDFNPDPANWSFLPEGETTLGALGSPAELAALRTEDAHAGGHALIRTLGERPTDAGSVHALFPPGAVGALPAILAGAAAGTAIVRANCTRLDEYLTKDLVDSITEGRAGGQEAARLAADFASGKSVYIEFVEDGRGDAIMEAVAGAAGFVISEDWAVELRFAGIDG